MKYARTIFYIDDVNTGIRNLVFWIFFHF